MAYNPGIEQDDEQQAQGADDAGTNQLAGGSGVISGQTSGQAQKQKGSGFVNIGQYLGANQADLAGQTDKAISKVNEGWGSANENLAASKSGFDTAADQNRVTLGDASTTEDDKQFASTFLKDSKLGAEDAGKFASWQNMSYQGPTELQDTWSADQKKSDDLASTLSNPNGYFPAMDEIFGNGRSDYTAGSQRLDASLMAADKTGQERINQNTAQQQQAISSSIQAAQAEAANKAKQYQTEAQSGKDAAWEALNDYTPKYMNDLVEQVASKNSERDAEYMAAIAGGPASRSFTVSNIVSGNQSSDYQDAIDKINTAYRDNHITKQHRDEWLAEVASNAFSADQSLYGSYTGPTKSDYVKQGKKVGLGSLDPSVTAKLSALYSLSGNSDLQNKLESEAVNTLGFNDIMRGGSDPAYSFDQVSFDAADASAKDAAIKAILDAEVRRQSEAYARQADYNANFFKNHKYDYTTNNVGEDPIESAYIKGRDTVNRAFGI